jgi:hypothetical protein
MLDEEAFPARSATEALVDHKLQQVAAYRATQADQEARRLLYEVLARGQRHAGPRGAQHPGADGQLTWFRRKASLLLV